jgi:hypothetical protein
LRIGSRAYVRGRCMLNIAKGMILLSLKTYLTQRLKLLKMLSTRLKSRAFSVIYSVVQLFNVHLAPAS